MIRVAIVEDNVSEAKALQNLLLRYGEENGVAVEIELYDKPLAFLSEYRANYDVIFFDVEMPGCNGLKAAKEIRETDDSVVIVFVTHMAQYAAKGYKVDATDYIVKPVSYKEFVPVMARVRRRLSVKQPKTHTIRYLDGVSKVDVAEIVYVEVARHRLFYHMVSGDVIEAWGTLTQVEKELPQNRFIRCNNCYLVNLQFVRGVKNDVALVGKEELRISRPRKQTFVAALVAYAGE